MTKKKLDIKIVLSKLDNNDNAYFDMMSMEDKQSLSPWVLMRYMSSSSANSEINLLTINEVVNKHFNVCNKRDDLTLTTLCACGFGTKQYHPWIAPPKSGEIKDKIRQLISIVNPEWNHTEMDLFLSINTPDQICVYLEENGVDVDE